MLSHERIAEILDQAANDIEANGWQRFYCAQYTRPYLHGGPGAMSALGAIQNVITGSPSRWDTSSDDSCLAEIDQVMACLDERYVRLNPDGWYVRHAEPFVAWHSETDYPSARPCRTKSEILAFLRAAADELRATDTGDAGDAAGGWMCPECGEDVQEVPPVRVTPGCPPQKFSHLDGESLCPVIGDAGYCPATPVRKNGTHGVDGGQGGVR